MLQYHIVGVIMTEQGHIPVLAQLSRLGLKFRLFGRKELKELASIIKQGEKIRHCTHGHYPGGSALLVATDARLLLVDKKSFFLNLKDIRYEMIEKVKYTKRFLSATASLSTGTKKLEFSSFFDARLHKLCHFVQDQTTKARQLKLIIEDHSSTANERNLHSLLPRKRAGKHGNT